MRAPLWLLGAMVAGAAAGALNVGCRYGCARWGGVELPTTAVDLGT